MASKVSRFLPGIAGLMLLLLVSEASAIVLGDVRSSSRVGQILYAEIEVDEHPAERFDPSCLRLYRPESLTDELPWITAARLSYRRESGKGKLSIVSHVPLQDPAVHLGVRSECAVGGSSRQYTLLLSAPATGASGQIPRPAIAPSVSLQSAAAAAPAADRRAAEPLAARGQAPTIGRPGPETSSGAKGEGGGGVPLRMSEELAASGQASALGRDLLRLEHRTLQMLNDPNDDRQALNEKLAWLEANVAELKRAGDRLEGVAAAIPAASAERPAGSSAAPPAALPTAPASSPSPAMVLPVAPAETPAQQAGRTSGQGPARQAPAAIDMKSGPWVWIGGGLAAVSLLVWLLVFRRRRGAVPEGRPPEASASSAPARTEANLSRTTTTVAVPVERPAPVLAPAPVPAPAANTAPASRAQPVVVQALALPEESESSGAAPALELAEIMLSFGRVSGAAKTLEEYLAAQPQESLRPWIRLLQIYQRNGMRDEFEALTLRLNRSFNVEILRWDGGESREELELLPLDKAREKAVTVEEIPRIRDQIISLWGKQPACRDYLEKLLRDNRDGQRSGFTLPVVEEVLFLIDLIEACQGPKPFPHP